MKCKNPLDYGTFNSWTLSSTSRYEELIYCEGKHRIDALSIHEHRFYHPDTEIQYKITTGFNPTGVGDFFSFSAWAHFFSRTFAQKELFGIFIRAL